MALLSPGDPLTALYQEILGRDPDPEGYAYWASTGLSPTEIAMAMMETPENRQQDISGYYQDVLGRAPDQEGLNYWLGSNLGLGDIYSSIYNSPENRYQDITQLGYRDILQRDPDQPGLDFWAQGPLPIPEAIDAIYNSEEARRLRGDTSGWTGLAPPGPVTPNYGNDSAMGNVINGVNRGAPVGVGNVPNIPLPKNFATAALGPANDAASMLALGLQPSFSAASMREASPLMQRYLSPVQQSYWQLASQFAKEPYVGKPWGDMPWGQMGINNQTGQMNYAPQGNGTSFNQGMQIIGPMFSANPTMTQFPGWQGQFPGWAPGANLGLGS